MSARGVSRVFLRGLHVRRAVARFPAAVDILARGGGESKEQLVIFDWRLPICDWGEAAAIASVRGSWRKRRSTRTCGTGFQPVDHGQDARATGFANCRSAFARATNPMRRRRLAVCDCGKAAAIASVEHRGDPHRVIPSPFGAGERRRGIYASAGRRPDGLGLHGAASEPDARSASARKLRSLDCAQASLGMTRRGERVICDLRASARRRGVSSVKGPVSSGRAAGRGPGADCGADGWVDDWMCGWMDGETGWGA